jgi:mannosyltransferase OCH1-like enzyme
MHSAEQPTIFQYWHEEPAPDYIEELLSSFRERNPGMRHLVFSERSAREMIGERYGEREVAAFDACGVPAMQADYFRYCAVRATGGLFVDADARCIGSLEPLFRGGGTLFEHRFSPVGLPVGVINGLFAIGAAEHPLPRLAMEIATANIENRVAESVWGVTGPGIFGALVTLLRAGSIEAMLELVDERRGEFDPKGRRLWDASVLCAVVGDYERVARAFEGVPIRPREWIKRFVLIPPKLAYKQTGAHWVKGRATIYR